MPISAAKAACALWLGLALLTPSLPVCAQIHIGMTSGFSGPAAAGVKENAEGAQLVFDDVNAKGGVHGQRVVLLTMDDANTTATAVSNARTLVTQRNVLALFLSRGTPHVEAMRPLLHEFRVPLVAPSSGAVSLHKPAHPWIFNVRSPYQRETEKAVQHLATIGMARIAVWHADDSFGEDGAAGAAKGFLAARLQPLLVATFDRSGPTQRLDGLAAQAASRQAQAVIIIGSSQAVAASVKALRARGSTAQVITLSNNASAGFVKMLGPLARGTIVTQVFPNERAIGIPMVSEAVGLARMRGHSGATPAMLEGFAGAKVLVEGLRRAGNQPTRESLAAALNAMGRFNLGGMEIGYSPDDHSGLSYVELSIIDAEGRFAR